MADGNAAPASTGLTDNVAGALAYVTIIPAIIFLIVEPYNKNSFVRFHSLQSIFFCVSVIVIDMILGMLFAFTIFWMPLLHLALWPLVTLFWLGVWALCVYNAYQGKRFKLPLIGTLAEQIANK